MYSGFLENKEKRSGHSVSQRECLILSLFGSIILVVDLSSIDSFELCC
ncbi:hypothetical protein ERO13_D11G270066v2 [Gossypium hirsutum]|uniref:Uncharacterized protein n=1 Tax=Gossypium darwinii TaxID=34276 RepID=A0A5D2AUE4_GOSDA|nr:hypothetical protein ERO13_D11G270066v2 [Gossypium hirsutum]TYG47166.1 hypothetical protein ES288_D11G316500v1 [Gossypium darwinii]